MKFPIFNKYPLGRGKLGVLLILTVLTLGTACNSDSRNRASAGQRSLNSQDGGDHPNYNEQEAAEALEQVLADFEWETIPEVARIDTIRQLVEHFYEERAYRPAWNTYTVSERTQSFLDRLGRLEQDGLDTADFRLNSLKQEISQVFDDSDRIAYDELAALEVELSATYLALARQVGKGRIEPEYANDWHIHPEEVDKLNNLKQALSEGIEEALAELEPDYRQYDLLKEELEQYLAIAREGGWGQLRLENTIAVGDSSETVRAIRKRLARETELSDTESPLYDEELAEVLQDFRHRYNVSTERNEIDDELVAALNVPVEERIRIISLNLERCRWLTEPMGDRYLIVNLPEYRLRVVEAGEPVLDMKVIVGKSVNATPIFSDSMEYVEFAPYWNVPASISHEEILPHAQEDPSYLEERNYELVEGWHEDAPVIPVDKVNWEEVSIEDFPYRVRQKPGPWNSLGRVKFMFPNNKAIYLHDTPQDHLFETSEREFSHGCVRVEKPDVLADYLLPHLNEAQVERYMKLDNRRVVPLEEKLPVYLVYFTTVVDSNGELRFLDDIYGLDEIQRDALSNKG